MLDYSIIISVHNESENIKNLILEIKDVCKGNYEIIVVNDKSTDNTLEILLELEDKIVLINHKINLGQSRSMITGTLKFKFNICVFIDGDGQNNPIYINEMVKSLEDKPPEIKLNIGTRFNRKSGFSKTLQSYFGNNIRSYILDDKCSDSGCGLKIIYKDVFLSLQRFNNMHRFIPYLVKLNGYKHIETKLVDRPRKYGHSHYNLFTRAVSIIELYICFILWYITGNLRKDI